MSGRARLWTCPTCGEQWQVVNGDNNRRCVMTPGCPGATGKRAGWLPDEPAVWDPPPGWTVLDSDRPCAICGNWTKVAKGLPFHPSCVATHTDRAKAALRYRRVVDTFDANVLEVDNGDH